MKNISWIITIVCACLGFIFFIGGLLKNPNAAELAAISASSVALAVLPYCIARAITELENPKTSVPSISISDLAASAKAEMEASNSRKS
jgi:hypothetical protein